MFLACPNKVFHCFINISNIIWFSNHKKPRHRVKYLKKNSHPNKIHLPRKDKVRFLHLTILFSLRRFIEGFILSVWSWFILSVTLIPDSWTLQGPAKWLHKIRCNTFTTHQRHYFCKLCTQISVHYSIRAGTTLIGFVRVNRTSSAY